MRSGQTTSLKRVKPLVERPTDMPTPEQTLAAAEGQWRKILAVVMHKQGLTHIALSGADVAAMGPGKSLVIQEGRDGDGLLHVDLVDADTAAALLSNFAGGKKL